MGKKITPKEMAFYLMRDGQIKKQRIKGNQSYVIVKSHGHNYWIDDPWGNKPRITQLADDPVNVSKN